MNSTVDVCWTVGHLPQIKQAVPQNIIWVVSSRSHQFGTDVLIVDDNTNPNLLPKQHIYSGTSAPPLSLRGALCNALSNYSFHNYVCFKRRWTNRFSLTFVTQRSSASLARLSCSISDPRMFEYLTIDSFIDVRIGVFILIGVVPFSLAGRLIIDMLSRLLQSQRINCKSSLVSEHCYDSFSRPFYTLKSMW